MSERETRWYFSIGMYPRVTERAIQRATVCARDEAISMTWEGS